MTKLTSLPINIWVNNVALDQIGKSELDDMERLFKAIETKLEERKFNLIITLATFALWFLLITTALYEVFTLFSDSWIGIIESIFSSQINFSTGYRSGLEWSDKGHWVRVDRDTMFTQFNHVYKVIYFLLWIFLLFELRKPLFKNACSKERRKDLTKALSSVLHYPEEDLKKGFSLEPRDTNSEKSDHYKLNLPLKKSARVEKACPFCAEMVLSEATKCKHCGSMIGQDECCEVENGNNDKTASSAPNHSNEESSQDATSKHPNAPFNLKKVAIAVGVFMFVLIIANKGNDSSNNVLSETAAKGLCRHYIANEFGRPASIINTKHLKFDGGHFVKASYNRQDDNNYYEYICHLYKGTIVWAGVFSGNDIGRWRYEDEMKYRKVGNSSWELY